MRHVRVLLAGENPQFIHAVSDYISGDPGVEVVGCATTGPQSVQKARLLAPDVVVVDVAMPEMGGLEVTQQIKSQAAPPCVILLSLDNNREYQAAARHAGADHFLAKSDVGVALLPIIWDLCVGRDYAAGQRFDEKEG